MKKLTSLTGALMGLVVLASAAPAHAVYLTANGAYGIPGGDAFTNADNAFTFGGELTFGLDMLQLGGFFDHTSVNYPAGDSSFNAYGVVARISPPATDLFADVKLGLMKPEDIGGSRYDTTVLWGVGVGYKVGLAPFVSISPRVGYRGVSYKPSSGTGTSNSVNGSIVDLGVLLSFGF
jgi:hypothetical protein